MRKIRIENEDGTWFESLRGGSYPHTSSDLNLRKGEKYLVEPMNPKKMRHRGRLCTFEGHKQDDYGGRLRVRFFDNGRPGVVDLSDLIEAPATATVTT